MPGVVIGGSNSGPSSGAVVDTGIRRRLFAGFRPLSTFGRIRSTQHRSISLPESNY